jgi:hypothetical protein
VSRTGKQRSLRHVSKTSLLVPELHTRLWPRTTNPCTVLHPHHSSADTIANKSVDPDGKLWVRPKDKAEADSNRDSRARLRAELRDVRPLPKTEADSNRDARAKARTGPRDVGEYKGISKKKSKKNQGLRRARPLQYGGEMSIYEDQLGRLSNASSRALDYGHGEV